MPRLSLVHFGEAKVWPCAPIRTAPDPKPLVPGGIALATVDPAKLWRQSLANSPNLPDTRGVIELTEPQVWTLIGVFATSTFAMIGIVTGTFTRVLRAEIGGLRSEIGGLRAEMNARFETVDTKFDHLDRDIQALTRHVFPD